MNSPKTNKTLKFDRDKRVFLLFLGLSAFIWLVINLSKMVTITIPFAVEYTNLPSDKLLESTPVKTVNIQLKGQGFKLFRHQLAKKSLTVDLQKVKKKSSTSYYFLPNSNTQNIKSQLGKNIEIVNIDVDSIFVKLSQKNSKKVPIQLKKDITFKVGYSLSKKLKIQPDSIVISGAKSVLDTVNYIQTNSLKLQNVDTKIEQKLAVWLPKEITSATKNITVSGTVEKFTEGTLSVPFSVKNLPVGANITTFPKEVKVTYQVPLSQYSKIVPSSFTVICDYQEAVNNQVTFLEPKLITNSSITSEVKVSPKKIDFLISK